MVTPRDKERRQPIRGEARSHLAHVKIALSGTGLEGCRQSASRVRPAVGRNSLKRTDPMSYVHIIRTPRAVGSSMTYCQ